MTEHEERFPPHLEIPSVGFWPETRPRNLAGNHARLCHLN
jgi:hypothetical protein